MALPVRHSNEVRRDAARTPRWDPFDELDRVHRELSDYLRTWRPLPGLLGGGFTPLADLEETNDAYTVEIELPGVQRGDVDIEVAGRRVTVRGERREKERAGILRRRERIAGQFSYEVLLPGDVDEDAVDAHLSDGVLTIVLPKPDGDRPRHIEVRGN